MKRPNGVYKALHSFQLNGEDRAELQDYLFTLEEKAMELESLKTDIAKRKEAYLKMGQYLNMPYQVSWLNSWIEFRSYGKWQS